MDPTKPLLKRPAPHNDESLRGYVARLAKANRYQSGTLLLSSINVSGESPLFLFDDSGLRKLSLLTTYPIHVVEAMTFNQISDEMQNLPFIKKYGFSYTGTKICPCCLKEKCYLRKEWDINIYCCCPLHKSLLQGICQQCGTRIKPMRVDFPVCECGFDYRESVVVPASEDLVSLANMLLHKIYSNQSPHKEINQHVHELSLFELISFIMRISVLIASKLERVHKLQFQNNHQLPAILQNVMNTLYEWPVNFHWLLHQLVKVPAKGKTIASLMSQLYEMFNEQKYEFVIKK